MPAPDDRLADLREACQLHPELASTLLSMLQQVANGPEPRRQKRRLGHARELGTLQARWER